jgi:hypothetical protein
MGNKLWFKIVIWATLISMLLSTILMGIQIASV